MKIKIDFKYTYKGFSAIVYGVNGRKLRGTLVDKDGNALEDYIFITECHQDLIDSFKKKVEQYLYDRRFDTIDVLHNKVSSAVERKNIGRYENTRIELTNDELDVLNYLLQGYYNRMNNPYDYINEDEEDYDDEDESEYYVEKNDWYRLD